MNSPINELIKRIESERVRLNDSYNTVDNYFLLLIDLIKRELNDVFLSDDVTEKYKRLRDNWLESIYYCFGSDNYYYESQLPQIIENFKIIKLFSFISRVKSTTIIIGANGSGKSSLINELRKNNINEIFILPAQKLLYFVSTIHNRNEITKEKYIQDLKEVDIKYDTIDLQTLQIEKDFS